MEIAVISLAFLAGVAIFFSPCGIALLPAYVAHLISQSGSERLSLTARAIQGTKIGTIVSLGIITVFISVGIIISLLGNFIGPYAAWLAGLTGLILIILGILMFSGRVPTLHLPHSFGADRSGFTRFYLYGVGYAIGGISCTLPVFLLVVFASLGSGTFYGGLVNFIAFTAGTVILMLIVTILSSVSGELVGRWLKRYMGVIQRASAIIIIAAGVYLIYFQLRAFDPLGFWS